MISEKKKKMSPRESDKKPVTAKFVSLFVVIE